MDTNVVSELRLPAPDPNVAAWLAAQSETELAIASYSVAEIEYGIAAAPPSRAAQLELWLNAILATQRILPLDARAAQTLGRLYAVPALRHLVVPPAQTRRLRFAGDLAIAATAVAHEASIATRNITDFRLIAAHCVGLAGIDPWTGQTF